ncbi:MAG: hypothetical protein M3Y24_09295 [Acidobacteriota bacterium]|nr:hypothetical protein [Acidobacteriota bacterium]
MRGVRLARTRNVNLALPVLSDQPMFTDQRLDPALNGIYQLEDSASSIYHGLSLAFRVMKPDFTLDTSYTYSKAIDNASDYAEQPQNPYAARDDRGLSSFDVRDRLVLFDLPVGGEEGRSKHQHRGLFVRLFSNIELALILAKIPPSSTHSAPVSAPNINPPISPKTSWSMNSPNISGVSAACASSKHVPGSPRISMLGATTAFSLLSSAPWPPLNAAFTKLLPPLPKCRKPVASFL